MPTQGNRAAWPSSDDAVFLSFAVILVALGFGGYEAWINYHAEIAAAFAVLAHWQIVAIGWFTQTLKPLDVQLRSADPSTVTARQILDVSGLIGSYLRLPAVVLLVLLGVLCLTRAAPSRFTRSFDLDRLIHEQAQSFRAVAAYAGRRLKLVPLQKDVRPLDPALHVQEWVERFARSPAGAFDSSAATMALGGQLGAPWKGIKHAKGHVRVLYAAFALHLAQRRSEAQDLLGAFSEAMGQGDRKGKAGPVSSLAIPPGVVAQATAILRDAALLKRAEAVAGRHAFTTPALMSLLIEARRVAGVLAPAQFLALKLVDRPLWYALHSLGFEGDGPGQNTHPNPRVEAIGARDHWAAERIAGRPLTQPSIARALAAVRAGFGQDGALASAPEAS